MVDIQPETDEQLLNEASSQAFKKIRMRFPSLSHNRLYSEKRPIN